MLNVTVADDEVRRTTGRVKRVQDASLRCDLAVSAPKCWDGGCFNTMAVLVRLYKNSK